MLMKKNIVCIKHGDKYSPDYVNKLFHMVERNLSLPYRFICLTENPTGLDAEIEVSPILTKNLNDSYIKFGLFEKHLHDITGEVLFLDLDMVIINPIDELFLFEPDAEFVGQKEWTLDCMGSNIMRFEVGKYPYVIESWYEAVRTKFVVEEYFDPARNGNKNLYYDLNSSPPEIYRGDQEWVTKQLREHNVHITYYPYEWSLSYKWHVLKETTVDYMNAKIINFHGLPKMEDIDIDWVKEHWK